MPADGGNDSNPGTSAAPFATIGAAITAAGANAATIHVADGTYQEHSLTLAGPITIVGESGNRDAVIVDANSEGRAFDLNHASSVLSCITIRNGLLNGASVSGGNIYISSNGGMVTNCVVANGRLTSINSSSFTTGGGNIFMGSTAALVVDCIVTNGSVAGSNRANAGNIFADNGRVTRCVIANGSSSSYVGCGGNAVIRGSAIIDNCLITGGTLTGGDYGSGVCLRDTTTCRLVNCTVIGNSGTRGLSNKNKGKVINCVIYNNGGTPTKEWGGDNAAGFINCAVAAEAASGFSGSGCVKNLTALDFADYANGDYSPAAGGVLYDTGAIPSSYTTADCSISLNGVERPSGPQWDIGAYESDQNKASCSFVASAQSAPNGTSITFTPTVTGISGTITYKWEFDDDGVATITADAPYTYQFVTTKPHYVTLSVSSDGGSTWKATFSQLSPIQTAPKDIWLDASNSSGAAFPYATPATAATDLHTVLGMLTNALSSDATFVDGVTIHAKQGTYTGAGYLSIASAVTIQGEGGSRDAVVFDGDSAGRVFSLNHASAVLSGISIRNGNLSGAAVCGGNIYIDDKGGVVRNCVVASGKLTSINNPSSFVHGGGNIYMNSAFALVTDCVVTNGSVTGTRPVGGNICSINGRVARCVIAKGRAVQTSVSCNGGNLFMTGQSVAENCLITGGSMNAGGSNYGSGVCMRNDSGNTRLVNCTVAGNISDSGSAVYSKDGGKVLNCVIYGNGGTAATEWGNNNAACFYNCAFSADAEFSGGASCITDLTDAAFKNYANGNYHPVANGALFNAGDTELYSTYGATSTTDLDGAARIVKNVIDIGCYEAAPSAGLQIYVR